MRANITMLAVWLFSGTVPSWPGEKLLYSVTYEEEILRTRRFTRTEIYAIEPGQSEGKIIFTDARADILLLPIRPSGERDQVMSVGGHRIFGRGVQRSRYSGGWYERPASIYELSADGTSVYRKVCELEGEQRLSLLFVQPGGLKLGYLNQIGNTMYLFIHDTASGKLQQKVKLGGIFLDCFARNMGWTADGQRLFFTLETGDVHVTSEASYKLAGSYLMNEDGTGLQRIPASAVAPPQNPGFRSDSSLPPVILAVLPGGGYLVRAHMWKIQGANSKVSTFLYATDPAAKTRRAYAMSRFQGLYWFRVAGSGRFIAITDQPNSEAQEGVWVLDLGSGTETKLFSFATNPFKPPYLGIIGWLIE